MGTPARLGVEMGQGLGLCSPCLWGQMREQSCLPDFGYSPSLSPLPWGRAVASALYAAGVNVCRLRQSRAMSRAVPRQPPCLSLGRQCQSSIGHTGAQQERAAPRAALEPVLAKDALELPLPRHSSGSPSAIE